jgi:hypothetical protein
METFLRETTQQRSLNPWYVTGLVDGEGSFTFNRCGNHMNLCFAMKLTGQDRNVLVLLQSFFGEMGYIYSVKAFISNSGRTKASAYFRVTRISDLLRIIKHFEEFPLVSTKKQAFQIWREMVIFKRDNFKKKHQAKLEILAKELSAISPRNQAWHT